jgi:anaerobic ribonucleoside-triphosphate reductase activating protein
MLEEGLTMVIFVADVQSGITTLGPGRRIVVWTEGCSLDCPGCISPELFSRRPTSRRELGTLVEEIVADSGGHDGLTVSGGEPFQQPIAVAALVRAVRRATPLDILVYSGYTLEEIKQASDAMRVLLGEVDMLIDGRFVAGESNCKIWRGSDNQRMHLLTPRAARYADIANTEYGATRGMHVVATRDGGVRLVGIPRRSVNVVDRLRQHGIQLLTELEVQR